VALTCLKQGGHNDCVPLTPRSLILDLFGDYLRYVDAEVRLGHLTTLLGAFDVAPATVRVTLSRLRREGWFSSRRVGRETVYRLSDDMLDVLEQGRRRIFAPPLITWDRTWTMVIYQLSESERQGREELRKGLAWHGFGPLTTSTWLAPGDRRAEIEAATGRLYAGRVDVFCCTSRNDLHDRELAGRCWDLEGLAKEYRAFLETYAELAAQAEDLTGAKALAARTELVSIFRHFPFKDPRLPVDLCPPAWPGVQAHELFFAAHRDLGPAARAYVGEVLGRTVPDPDRDVAPA
jgi:phenylacetic acid degradation operon negative regulatory protein